MKTKIPKKTPFKAILRDLAGSKIVCLPLQTVREVVAFLPPR